MNGFECMFEIKITVYQYLDESYTNNEKYFYLKDSCP